MKPSALEVLVKASELAKFFLHSDPTQQFELGSIKEAYQPSGFPITGIIIRHGLCNIHTNGDEFLVLSYPLSALHVGDDTQFALFETNKLNLTKEELNLLWANFTFFVSSYEPAHEGQWS